MCNLASGIVHTFVVPKCYFLIAKPVVWKCISKLVKLIATASTGEYSKITTYNGINLMNDTAEKSVSLEKVNV